MASNQNVGWRRKCSSISLTVGSAVLTWMRQFRITPPLAKPELANGRKAIFSKKFFKGNTAQFTAEALSVASLADFPATVTKMLANTQSIREHFCLTCQKTGRRASTLRIVRCCLKGFLFAAFALFSVGSFKGIRCMQ